MELSDVTLREGDQQPGMSYTVAQKVEAGRRLDRLGIDYVQAGFPITGETDREAIGRLANDLVADVVGLARARSGDVEAAAAADADVVDIIVPASERQRPHVFGGSQDEVLAAAGEAIDAAREHGLTVHLTLMDAFRSEFETVSEYFVEFPAVPCITLADTVGAKTPRSVASFVEAITDAADASRLGVHFHDDMGVATANSLAAADAGAKKLDVSVATIGERAGNASLEEVVTAGTVDGDVAFDIELEQLVPACTDVLDILDESIEPDKSVLGSRVFAHESGLHTAAMLEDPGAFEPFDPSQFGGRRKLLFGEGTGRSAARSLIQRAGYSPTDDRIDRLLKELAERGPVETADAIELAADCCE